MTGEGRMGLLNLCISQSNRLKHAGHSTVVCTPN